MKNKTAYYVRSTQKFELRQDEIGSLPTPYHVLVKNKWVGICGSDIHALELDFLTEIVLGHEWVGEILEVGEKVSDLKVGDFVTSSNKILCGYCENCQTKKEECTNLQWLTANNGMFREYFHLPVASLVKLPDPVGPNSTLFEIIAVAENVWLKAHKQFKKANGKVIIMGAGLVGLSLALVLQREGISFEMVEMIPSRMMRAESLGFRCRLLGEVLMDPKCRDYYQVVVDATGDHLGSAGGFKYIDHLGAREFEAIILGKYIHDIPFKTLRFFTKEANVRWIQGCTVQSLELSIAHWKNSLSEIGSKLVTHQFSLDQIEEAFQTAKNRKISGRVIIEI